MQTRWNVKYYHWACAISMFDQLITYIDWEFFRRRPKVEIVEWKVLFLHVQVTHDKFTFFDKKEVLKGHIHVQGGSRLFKNLHMNYYCNPF